MNRTRIIVLGLTAGVAIISGAVYFTKTEAASFICVEPKSGDQSISFVVTF